MRCPSCGTENAPDSRFCGVCGAKQPVASAGAAAPRLAPTAKIPDDAPYPTGPRQPVAYQQGPASIPPPAAANPYGATGPASIPPSSHGPASIPPSNHGRPSSIPPHQAQRAPTPPADRPSSSLGRAPSEPAPTQQRRPIATPTPAGSIAGDDSFAAPPQRPLGLIAIVLVIDLALAGAGAVLLSKGLAAKKIKEQPAEPTAPTMQQRSDVTTPAPTPVPAPSPSPVEAVAAAAPEAKVGDSNVAAAASPILDVKTDKAQARAKDAKKTKAGASGASTTSSTSSTSSGPVTRPGGTTPEDPYKDQPPPSGGGGFDLKAESNKLATQSGELFARCLAAAGTVHGTIKVAYRVEADGRVTHPFAVENSTGNEQLGICLSDVIATWRFSPHSGDAQNAVRPFTYP